MMERVRFEYECVAEQCGLSSLSVALYTSWWWFLCWPQDYRGLHLPFTNSFTLPLVKQMYVFKYMGATALKINSVKVYIGLEWFDVGS